MTTQSSSTSLLNVQNNSLVQLVSLTVHGRHHSFLHVSRGRKSLNMNTYFHTPCKRIWEMVAFVQINFIFSSRSILGTLLKRLQVAKIMQHGITSILCAMHEENRSNICLSICLSVSVHIQLIGLLKSIRNYCCITVKFMNQNMSTYWHKSELKPKTASR